MVWRGHSLRVQQRYPEPRRKVTPKVSMPEQWPVALWCKVGGHAFDPDDPDKHVYTETGSVRRQTGNSYGQPVYQTEPIETSRIAMCGPCWIKQRPFQSPTAIPPGADKETYTEYLEHEAGIPPQ